MNPMELITRDQVEAWVGRDVTDEEWSRLDDAIPNSSIPEAVRDIMDAIERDDG